MPASLSSEKPERLAPPREQRRAASRWATLADAWFPRIVLAPSVVISLVFVYGFILVTGYCL